MEKYQQQLKEIVARWQALSVARKLGIGILCVAICGLLAMFWWTGQTEYRVLYSGLAADEAGAITGKLQAKGVSFKLGANGTTILVPADQAMQIHLDLTSEGVNGSSKVGKGFELFDQQMLTSTPFNQHVNYVRAQQNELARTIMQIDPVVYARVQIARPEPSPFIRDQKPTTASVLVKLRPGAQLSRNAAAAIAGMVAGSVEGLSKENVRIIDAAGNSLSEDRDPETGLAGTLLDQRKDLERHLAREAEIMLAKVLGQGKAIVRVTTELNMKQVKERQEIIMAEGKVARSEKIKSTKSQSGAPTKGGVPGVGGNSGKGATPPTGAAATNSTEETQQSDYEYPRTWREWQNKYGGVERLTVAAFVDLSSMSKSEQPLVMADVQEIIKKAVGFKGERDEIQVTQVKMPVISTDAFEEDVATHIRWATVLTIVRNVSIAMVALCLCPIVWMIVRRVTRTVPMPAAEPAKVQRITAELDRNPEALAKILSVWMERAEKTERKAA